MEILFTGFEPFGGETSNPSWDAVSLLPETIGGAQVRRLLLPVAGERALARIREALRERCPDAVIAVGQAGGRTGVTPERVAVNVDDYRIPDADGFQPADVPVVPDGPAAYFATLPVKAMVRAIRDAGLPASLSDSAGTYVCNHVLYGLLHLAAAEYPGLRCGFVHVPYSAAQAAEKPGAPSMSLPDMARALEAAASALLA